MYWFLFHSLQVWQRWHTQADGKDRIAGGELLQNVNVLLPAAVFFYQKAKGEKRWRYS